MAAQQDDDFVMAEASEPPATLLRTFGALGIAAATVMATATWVFT